MVQLGIDVLLTGSAYPWGKADRLGLLCNHASLNKDLHHSRLLIQKLAPQQLCCLFSPQHGFDAEKQDNMIESNHMIDDQTTLPVFSLYGKSRKPTDEMLAHFDVLIVDLQDVGTRVYTYIYTLAYCLEAAAGADKKVVILDRPNPIGGLAIEGNLLDPAWASFVGLFPIPMRHGLTMGECALMINREFGYGANIEVVPLRGWQRQMYFADTGLHWLYPSPNMPTPLTAVVYPGQVIWEGTTVSEGRGTTVPFELCGAPYWHPREIAERLDPAALTGCLLRPAGFEPTSGKYAKQWCAGFHLHVIDRSLFKPYRTALSLLQVVVSLYPDLFAYSEPPYEYEYEKKPIDLILGDPQVRKDLEAGAAVIDMEQEWREGLQAFDKMRQSYFLYTQ